jgi:hypothetical protein
MVALNVSETTTLELTLVNAQGHVVAEWTDRVKSGKHMLNLSLPAKARHPGNDTLRIRVAGKKTTTKAVRVVLK